MNVKLSQQAVKYFKSLNEPTKSRIANALKQLGNEPLVGDIKNLTGKSGFRLRIGNYRILFDIINNEIVVFAIAPRGSAYKGI